MSIKKTTERFIAYFDIMGFKDLVYRNDHKAVEQIMNQICETVEKFKILRKNEKIKTDDGEISIATPVMFSDSIIFISENNTHGDAEALASIASCFLCKILEASIPIKGALTYGIFTADFCKSSFFGRPLIDAYLLAEEMYFYGAVLHHSFERYLKSHKKTIDADVIKRAPVPMKDGLITHSYINWTYFMTKKTDKESVLESFYTTVSGNTRRYVDNTISVYKLETK